MHFGKFTYYYSVLTNGETELRINCGRFDCGVDPKGHIVGQDGYGRYYIDGKEAHIEIRSV